jgi:hypothetical protein
MESKRNEGKAPRTSLKQTEEAEADAACVHVMLLSVSVIAGGRGSCVGWNSSRTCCCSVQWHVGCVEGLMGSERQQCSSLVLCLELVSANFACPVQLLPPVRACKLVIADCLPFILRASGQTCVLWSVHSVDCFASTRFFIAVVPDVSMVHRHITLQVVLFHSPQTSLCVTEVEKP